MRFLVVTMHAGEPQLERCTAALLAQEGVEIEHVVISDLPNLEAHARCYDEIQTRRADYDVALKLDADMVLAGSQVLEEIGRWFVADAELDHAQLALHDFFTDRPIMGLQVFSPRVRWPDRDDGLFVDAPPTVPGHRLDVWRPRILIAEHAPDPSLAQAFRFGIHRAQKAFQWDRDQIKGSQARDQWRTLLWTWQAFQRTGDVRRGVAVYGADLVWRRADDAWARSYTDQVERLLADVPKDAGEIRLALNRRWGRPFTRELLHFAALGTRRSGRLFGAALVSEWRNVRAKWGSTTPSPPS